MRNRSSSAATIDLNFAANIIAALYQPTENLSRPRFNCASGNCTWDPFTTLGFCPSCVTVPLRKTCAPYNISAIGSDRDCIVAFPTSASVYLRFDHISPYDDSSPEYMLVTGTSPNMSFAHPNNTWPGTVFQAIRAVIDPNSIAGGENRNVLTNSTRFMGTECTLGPCVMSINASVSLGVYSERVLKVWTQDPQPVTNTFDDLLLSPPWGPEDGMQVGQVFTISDMAVYTMDGSSLLGDQLTGTVSLNDRNTAIHFGGPEQQALFYANFSGTTCPTPEDNVACAFTALGAAATKAVRDAPMLANGTDLPWVEIGTTNVMGTFIRVNWSWFALPIMLWVLSLATVVAAATKTRATPLWKDDPLPLAFLYREERRTLDVHSPRDPNIDHSTIVENLRVRLINDQGKMKFSERTAFSHDDR